MKERIKLYFIYIFLIHSTTSFYARPANSAIKSKRANRVVTEVSTVAPSVYFVSQNVSRRGGRNPLKCKMS